MQTDSRTRLDQLLATSVTELETPCFVYDTETIRHKFEQLSEALGTPLILSVKAQSNLDVLSRISDLLTAGVEVASLAELSAMVRAYGQLPKYVNNPSMSCKFMTAAIASRANLIIDSLSQLDQFQSIEHHCKVASVILRVNMPAVRGGVERGNHFGFDEDSFWEGVRRCVDQGTQIRGLHLFAGSYSFGSTGLRVVAAAEVLLRALHDRYGIRPAMLNLGGGFDRTTASANLLPYRRALAGLAGLVDQIVHEAGRAVFEEGGFFLTRVVHTKRHNAERVAVCDGGMAQNFLLCQTERVVKNYASPRVYPERPRSDAATIRFVGSTCSQDDVIGLDSRGDVDVEPGDLCIFDNCGAYRRTYSVCDFLGLGAAKEYVI